MLTSITISFILCHCLQACLPRQQTIDQEHITAKSLRHDSLTRNERRKICVPSLRGSKLCTSCLHLPMSCVLCRRLCRIWPKVCMIRSEKSPADCEMQKLQPPLPLFEPAMQTRFHFSYLSDCQNRSTLCHPVREKRRKQLQSELSHRGFA